MARNYTGSTPARALYVFPLLFKKGEFILKIASIAAS
jgi:hypothetical protein